MYTVIVHVHVAASCMVHVQCTMYMYVQCTCFLEVFLANVSQSSRSSLQQWAESPFGPACMYMYVHVTCHADTYMYMEIYMHA